jgi:hypothetical protein
MADDLIFVGALLGLLVATLVRAGCATRRSDISVF